MLRKSILVAEIHPHGPLKRARLWTRRKGHCVACHRAGDPSKTLPTPLLASSSTHHNHHARYA
jgi:hypothetical protein